MKSTRFQYEYRKSASKYHKAIGNLLRITFPYLQIYQEYPVNRVNESYTESSHHFDWCIPTLQIVIEVHGQQHYKEISWVGDPEEAKENFRALKERDELKRIVCLSAGWKYLAIPFNECLEMTSDTLFSLIYTAPTIASAVETREDPRKEKQKEIAKQKRQEYLKSDKHKEELEKAREWRKMKYREAKEKHNAAVRARKISE